MAMTNRENFLAIARRTGYERMPVSFNMCPSLDKKFRAYTAEHPIEFEPMSAHVWPTPTTVTDPEVFRKNYYAGVDLKPGTVIDQWGVANEPGSAAAFHMTYMHHPMENFDSVEQILAYPLPVYDYSQVERIKAEVEKIHAAGMAAVGDMACTIWECAWYMRGMENLMCDMTLEDEMATVLLDRVTEISTINATVMAMAGVDAVYLGDDVGMQHSIMMSIGLYDEWLGPRLKRLISSAKAVKPDTIFIYHSCGHVTELIPSLMGAGIDVLNPVQPECMDFRELHDRFGDKLSFNGTLGTQTLMPFGTPDDVRRKVFENLDIAGEHGGLFVAPTHLLEPEVPVENIIAYIKACQDYRK